VVSDPAEVIPPFSAAVHLFKEDTLSHAVHFYEDDTDLTDHIMAYIDSGLSTGSSVIVIARSPFLNQLKARWLPLLGDRFVGLDASDTLSELVTAGRPDRERFMRLIGTLVSELAARTRHVYVFGEMVGLLWGAKQYDAALELEDFWNDLSGRVPFTLLCAYPSAAFQGEDDGKQRICDVHCTVAASYDVSHGIGKGSC